MKKVYPVGCRVIVGVIHRVCRDEAIGGVVVAADHNIRVVKLDKKLDSWQGHLDIYRTTELAPDTQEVWDLIDDTIGQLEALGLKREAIGEEARQIGKQFRARLKEIKKGGG